MRRTIVVEDEPRIRAWLTGLVEDNPALHFVGSAASLTDAESLLAENPEIILLDLMLEDGPAFDFLLRATTAGSKVLVVSVLGDEESVVQAVLNGASGYMNKEVSAQELAKAIEAVESGHAPMSPAIARHLLQRVQRRVQTPDREAPSLTRRERQVLEALANGLTYKEVARKLDLSPQTIAKYIKVIYRKMAVHNRAEAVMLGVRSGIIEV
ncbi:MAG: response regulator transcription factor [Alphaproteobacteria bacterium]|nr:response regulator transcription factor [Alphaproteobacteria bacterium]